MSVRWNGSLLVGGILMVALAGVPQPSRSSGGMKPPGAAGLLVGGAMIFWAIVRMGLRPRRPPQDRPRVDEPRMPPDEPHVPPDDPRPPPDR